MKKCMQGCILSVTLVCYFLVVLYNCLVLFFLTGQTILYTTVFPSTRVWLVRVYTSIDTEGVVNKCSNQSKAVFSKSTRITGLLGHC